MRPIAVVAVAIPAARCWTSARAPRRRRRVPPHAAGQGHRRRLDVELAGELDEAARRTSTDDDVAHTHDRRQLALDRTRRGPGGRRRGAGTSGDVSRRPHRGAASAGRARLRSPRAHRSPFGASVAAPGRMPLPANTDRRGVEITPGQSPRSIDQRGRRRGIVVRNGSDEEESHELVHPRIPRPTGSRRPRLPPGQYDTGRQWPVLTAEVTPQARHRDVDVHASRGSSSSRRRGRGTRSTRCPPSTYDGDIHCVTTWSKFGMTFDRRVGRHAARGGAAARRPRRTSLAFSHTGYTTNLPLADVTGGKAWVAWEVDGAAARPRARRPGAAARARTSTSGRAPSGSPACGCSTTTSPGSGSATATTTAATRGSSSATRATDAT